LNCDETGINIGRKRVYGMGALGGAKEILVHDYLKAYYGFTGNGHTLCNVHLIWELRLPVEKGQGWAQRVIEYLEGLNGEVDKAGGKPRQGRSGGNIGDC
jgi:hypothetical protein